jgi:hypothetical protein
MAPAQPQSFFPATYILPIKSLPPLGQGDFTAYVSSLAGIVGQVILVDGSLDTSQAAGIDPDSTIEHVAPDANLLCANGKVKGVLTGLRLARFENLIIADDDVRYDPEGLEAVLLRLDKADVVRPQNYFFPHTWNTLWDSGRTVLNRALGGDWSGTLGVHRSVLLRSGGYDGDTLFENLELVRTVLALGGRQDVAQDIFVRRTPPTGRHFLSQRVRQAYDEFARPQRLLSQLCILPLAIALRHSPRTFCALITAVLLVAEFGRRRDGGSQFISPLATLMAPLWLLERGVCSWLALCMRLRNGGVPYNGRVLAKAANRQADLDRRHAGARRSLPTTTVTS